MTNNDQRKAAAEMEKLCDELTEIIEFLHDEGYGFTTSRLIKVRDGFRSLSTPPLPSPEQ